MIDASQDKLSQLTGEIITWLDERAHIPAGRRISAWDAATWRLAQQAIFMQGIGPYLHDTLPGKLLWSSMPEDFQQWLAWQRNTNAARVERMHTDLQAVLAEANRAGLRVMPLKGSLLSTCYYPTPALRPMADIDLLVEPPALPVMCTLMERLGYAYLPTTNRYQNEYRFNDPNTRKVVADDCEHPDNPRPVEVHSGLRRGVWGGAGVYDLTLQMWSSAREITLLGERAWAPAPKDFLVSLVTHAFRNFFRNEGRVLHWIDLAYVIGHVQTVPVELANWSFPVYRMAQRALPAHFACMDLTQLAAATHPAIRRWGEQTPLNGACGLVTATRAPELRNATLSGAIATAWSRWQPTPWRLAVAFGDVSLVGAYGRYLWWLLPNLWARLRQPSFPR
jgi:hypothetical protein